MRPLLTLPADWKTIEQPHQTVYLAPTATTTPTILIAAGLMLPQVPDEEARIRNVLGVELGTLQLVPGGAVVSKTDAGWPLEVTPAVVVDGERTVEQRMLAFYRFAEWRALILVRGFSQEAWNLYVPAIRAALASARPGWRADGEVYCIAHLFEG